MACSDSPTIRYRLKDYPTRSYWIQFKRSRGRSIFILTSLLDILTQCHISWQTRQQFPEGFLQSRSSRRRLLGPLEASLGLPLVRSNNGTNSVGRKGRVNIEEGREKPSFGDGFLLKNFDTFCRSSFLTVTWIPTQCELGCCNQIYLKTFQLH